MTIPPELFEEITAAITVVGADAPLPADRRSQRLKLSTHVSVYPWDESGDSVSLRLRDLSVGGLGILCSHQLSLDDRFVVRLPRSSGRTQLALCSVMYWEPLAEGLFGIGARFDRLVDEAELSTRQEEIAERSMGVISRITHVLARKLRTAG